MKQSLIITVLICLVLGESFTFINQKDHQKNKATTYCCSKICTDEKAEKKGQCRGRALLANGKYVTL